MKNWFRNILMFLLLIIGLSALYSGIRLINQPDGSDLGLTTSYLDPNYFEDFSIPGLFLLIAVGLVSIILFIMLLAKIENYQKLLVSEGFILFSFIVVQHLAGIPFSLLQLGCMVIALIFVWGGIAKPLVSDH